MWNKNPIEIFYVYQFVHVSHEFWYIVTSGMITLHNIFINFILYTDKIQIL